MTADVRLTLLQDAHAENQGAYEEMKNIFDSIRRQELVHNPPAQV